MRLATIAGLRERVSGDGRACVGLRLIGGKVLPLIYAGAVVRGDPAHPWALVELADHELTAKLSALAGATYVDVYDSEAAAPAHPLYGSVPFCVKCGTPTALADSQYEGIIAATGEAAHEWITRTCGNCSYQWQEACLS